MPGIRHVILAMLAALGFAAAGAAQSVTVIRKVNLRPDPSSEYDPIRLLTPAEPPLTLLEPAAESGYYHVRTGAGEAGYVWSKFVRVSTAPPAASGVISLGPGIPGSAGMAGCGDGLWVHVYHPTRLLVKQDCLTVTGVIVDATAHQAHHRADGMRHEGDGDTHGWLKVDPAYAGVINAGNTSQEDGNLVFELVCHYPVSQDDAKPSCAGFKDHTVIPPVGSHVSITGSFVTEKNHGKWNEIHPVSRITVP
ncbi:MAG TPA: hypothetical protein VFU23_10080 [Gemmatimonadales bacterium]|nr:hypothetical protein [Gemmatimonadales bacterium]